MRFHRRHSGPRQSEDAHRRRRNLLHRRRGQREDCAHTNIFFTIFQSFFKKYVSILHYINLTRHIVFFSKKKKLSLENGGSEICSFGANEVFGEGVDGPNILSWRDDGCMLVASSDNTIVHVIHKLERGIQTDRWIKMLKRDEDEDTAFGRMLVNIMKICNKRWRTLLPNCHSVSAKFMKLFRDKAMQKFCSEGEAILMPAWFHRAGEEVGVQMLDSGLAMFSTPDDVIRMVFPAGSFVQLNYFMPHLFSESKKNPGIDANGVPRCSPLYYEGWNATIRAMEPSRLLEVRASDFDQILKECPDDGAALKLLADGHAGLMNQCYENLGLQDMTMFHSTNSIFRTDVLRHIRHKMFLPGEAVTEEFLPPKAVVRIMTGSLNLRPLSGGGSSVPSSPANGAASAPKSSRKGMSKDTLQDCSDDSFKLTTGLSLGDSMLNGIHTEDNFPFEVDVSEPTLVEVLPQKDVATLLIQHVGDQAALQRCLIQNIGKHPFFENIPDPFLEWILSRFRCMCIIPGQRLFNQGDHGDELFFIADGACEIITNDNNEISRTKVAQVGKFDLVGELSVLGISQERTCSVVATEFTKFYKLTGPEFRAAMERFPTARKLFEHQAAIRSETLQKSGNAVRHIPWWQSFSPTFLDHMDLMSTRKIWFPNQIIWHEGTATNTVFILQSGVIDLYTGGTLVETFKDGTLIETLDQPGMFIGAATALRFCDKSPFTAVARGVVDLRSITTADLDRFWTEPECAEDRKRLESSVVNWLTSHHWPLRPARHPMFQHLSDDCLNMILENCDARLVDPNQLIYDLNSPWEQPGLYMLIQGKVQVSMCKVVIEEMEAGNDKNKEWSFHGRCWGETTCFPGIYTNRQGDAAQPRNTPVVVALKKCVVWHMPLAVLHGCLAAHPADAATWNQWDRMFSFRKNTLNGAPVRKASQISETSIPDLANRASMAPRVPRKQRAAQAQDVVTKATGPQNYMDFVRVMMLKQDIFDTMDYSIMDHFAKAFEMRIFWPGEDYSHVIKDLRLHMVCRNSVEGVDSKNNMEGYWKEGSCFGVLSLDPVDVELGVFPHIQFGDEPALVAVMHQNVFMSWLQVWGHTTHTNLFRIMRTFRASGFKKVWRQPRHRASALTAGSIWYAQRNIETQN